MAISPAPGLSINTGASFLAGFILPNMHPITTGIFGAIHTQVQHMIQPWVTQRVEAHQETAIAAQNFVIGMFPQLEEPIAEFKKGKNITYISAIGLTYTLSALLTCNTMTLIGLPFAFRQAIIASGIGLALSYLALKTVEYALSILPGRLP